MGSHLTHTYEASCSFQLRGPLNIIADGDVNETEVGVVDPYNLITENVWEYYRYIGSLPTPPCSEGVVWTVLKEVPNCTLLLNSIWLQIPFVNFFL